MVWCNIDIISYSQHKGMRKEVINTGSIQTIWMMLPEASIACKELIQCKCTCKCKKKCSKRSSCKKQNLKCTKLYEFSGGCGS